jgi:hypothetical protein
MHAIRLKAPWQIDRDGNTVRYTRRFGLPTNLGPEERVSLVIEKVTAPARVELNAQLLGEQTVEESKKSYSITPVLQPRSEICISLALTDRQLAEINGELLSPSSDASPGTLVGEVRLEIE